MRVRFDRRPKRAAQGASGGLTLVELVISLGLLAVLLTGLFQLLDSSLSLWRRGEAERNLLEQQAVIGDLLASDLRRLDNTRDGDFVGEWVPFDTTGDGAFDTVLPRLRFVRRATPEEIDELRVGRDVPDKGLVEVLWCALPARGKKPQTQEERDRAAEVVLVRGERIAGDPDGTSFLSDTMFRRKRIPSPAVAQRLNGGILWLDVLFATQTSVVHRGWKRGSELEHAASSWDAWNRERPDPTHHAYNEPGAGMPPVGDLPLLPRRVRVEFEIERPKDLRRRTRLTEALDLEKGSFEVDNGRYLPGPGAYVKVGPEWMQVTSLSGDRVTVRRAQRGTRPLRHNAGSLVHFGTRGVREVPIELYREDWSLR